MENKIGELPVAMSQTGESFDIEKLVKQEKAKWENPNKLVINPLQRGLKRNRPCLCGSGKKAKRCCSLYNTCKKYLETHLKFMIKNGVDKESLALLHYELAEAETNGEAISVGAI